MRKALNQSMIKRIYGGITNNRFMYWLEPDVIFIIPEGTVGYIITCDDNSTAITSTYQYWLTFLSNLGINPDKRAKEVFIMLKERGEIMNGGLLVPDDIHQQYKYSYMVTNEKRYYFDNKLLKEFKKPQFVFDIVELNCISAAIVYEIITDRYGDNYYNYCAVIMGVRYEKT